MTSSLTRGPLPARVYWRRRLVVLGVALLLVLGLGRLLGGSSDGSDPERAAPVAAEPTAGSDDASDRPATDETGTPTAAASATVTRKPRKPTPTKPAEPEGPCEDADVAVTPSVDNAVAGAPQGIVVLLELRTLFSEACTWQVSPDHVTVKITSGKDEIWSSRQCPKVVPEQDVVVRRDDTTTVALTWNGRRSDDDCSRLTEWALPGWYHVAAAALGGEPSDVQFELKAPTAPKVTKTAKPNPSAGTTQQR